MKYSIKTVVFLLSFILLISLAANVYSFTKEPTSTNKNDETVQANESELLEKDTEIEDLKEQITTLEEIEGTVSNEVEAESESENTDVSEEGQLENAAKRFIEYAFESDPETYTTRKKMAKTYMTDNLYETLYSSAGEDEEKQDIVIDIKDINVFTDFENEDEAIVHYTYKEEIKSSGYEEEKKMYVKLSFSIEGNEFKVSDIEPLENEYGGI